MNTDERDARIDALFAQAKALSPCDQRQFLAANCSAEELDIQRELENLLAAFRAAPKGDVENRILPRDAVIRSLDVAEQGAATLPYVAESPGSQIGPYKLLEQIGEGGMGIVYMAEQTEPVARRVALKVIKPGMDSGQIVTRFEVERQALALMDHPHVARVLDAGTTDSGRPFFVMELVKGIPITQYCDEKRLTARQRLELFIQVCQAVEHAHQKGIIHRDLKPSNVMVAEYDHVAVPKIIDFGVAKATGGKLTDKTLFTQYGQIVGTVDYMSPEQAKFNQLDIDTRSDIYALGVLLYELVTGTTPFDRARLRAAAFDEVLRIIRDEEPPKPSTRLSASDTLPVVAANCNTEPQKLTRLVRGDLDWIVMKALAKERSDRYQTASNLAADIERHLADLPINARRPSTSVRVRKFVRRHRLPVALTATVFTAVVAAAVFGAFALFSQLRAAKFEHLRNQAELKSVQAELDRQEADDQRRLAQARAQQELVAKQVSRLTADARNLQINRPVQSVRLAIEALELSRLTDSTLRPLAHESLLNSIAVLSGRPLPGDGSKIVGLAATSNWLVSLHDQHPRVKLWDIDLDDVSLSSLVLPTGESAISVVTVSDDGRWLMTAGVQLRLWDLHASPPQFSSKLLSESVIAKSLGISPGGRWLVAQNRDRSVGLWDLASDDHAFRNLGEAPDNIDYAVLGPHGRWLALLIPNNILLWDLALSAPATSPHRLESHYGPNLSVAISPTGEWLATAQLGNARLWDLTPKDAPAQVAIPAQSIDMHHLAFARDGQWLFGASSWRPNTLCWKLPAGNKRIDEPIVLEGHHDGVRGLITSPDSRRLMSLGHLTGNFRLWNIAGEVPVQAPRQVHTHDAPHAVALHSMGRWLAVAAHDGSARIWDLRGPNSHASPFVLNGLECEINTPTAVSSDGRWIAAAVDNAIELWDTTAPRHSPRHRRKLTASASRIATLNLTPDDRWLIATRVNATSQFWDLRKDDLDASPMELGRPAENLGRFSHAAASSRWLATCGPGGAIQLWDIGTNDIPASRLVLQGHTEPVFCFALSRDDRWLVSAANDGIRLWDLDMGQPEPLLLASQAHESNTRIRIDANSRWLVAAHQRRGFLKIWDLPAKAPRTTLRVLDRPSQIAPIFQLAFSPDARWVFTGRYDRTAQLWDLTTDPPTRRELRGHDRVQHAEISSDSRWLVTANRLGNAQLWDLKDPARESSFRVLRGHEATIWQADISADSRWLVTFSGDGTIRRWNLDEDWLLDYARRAAGHELTEEELNR